MAAGDLVAGGFQNLAAGYQQYLAKRQQDKVASGQIDALIQNGGIQGVQQLSPDGQALFQKISAGKGNLNDKLQLLGEANTAIAQKQMMANIASTQAGTASTQAGANLTTTQNQMLQQRMGWLQQIMGGGPFGPAMQGGQPGGQPVQPGGQAGPQQPQGQGAPAPSAPQGGGMQGGSGTPNIPPYLQPNNLPGTPAPSWQNLQSIYTPPAQGGAGVPSAPQAPSVQLAPPVPLTIDSPQGRQLYQRAVQMTLGDTDRATTQAQQSLDKINQQRQQQYQAQADATSMTGNMYFNGFEYKDGIPINDLYSPETVKGKGTIGQSVTAGSQQISVPHGTKPPGPVVFRGSGAPDSTPQTAPFNTKDPAWQSGIQDAYNQAGTSAVALADSKLLMEAADAYTSGNTSRLNALNDVPGFAKFRQILTGTNPVNAFQIALSTNTQSILNQIRGPNGSVGGRILMPEYENTAKILGNPNMDNATILAASRNLYALNDRRNSLDQAYAHYRETMPAGDAEALAVKQFGAAPNLSVPGTSVRVISPDGRSGMIPASNLPQAIQAGYKAIQ